MTCWCLLWHPPRRIIKKSIFIFRMEGEQPHQNVLLSHCPFATRSLPDTTAGRAAPSGPPSCWLTALWRTSDVKVENISLSTLLQTEPCIFRLLLTLWIPLTLNSEDLTIKVSRFQALSPTEGSTFQFVKVLKLSDNGAQRS